MNNIKRKKSYKASGKSLLEKAMERAVLNAVGMLSRKGTDKLFKKFEEKAKSVKAAGQTKKAPVQEQKSTVTPEQTDEAPSSDLID